MEDLTFGKMNLLHETGSSKWFRTQLLLMKGTREQTLAKCVIVKGQFTLFEEACGAREKLLQPVENHQHLHRSTSLMGVNVWWRQWAAILQHQKFRTASALRDDLSQPVISQLRKQNTRQGRSPAQVPTAYWWWIQYQKPEVLCPRLVSQFIHMCNSVGYSWRWLNISSIFLMVLSLT